MVFPDSNTRHSSFLILYEDYNGEHFEWQKDIYELEINKKSFEKLNREIYFAGEIVILKDLTNS